MGEVLSLAAALTWAVAVVLFKRSGETVPPYALTFFRASVGSLLLLSTIGASGGALWHSAPLRDYLLLCISGWVAIALSDTLFHMGLNRSGAGINAIVDCLYSPCVVLLASVCIGERIRPSQVLGMALIIGGVVLTSRLDPPEGSCPRSLLAGIIYGALAMVALALGVVVAKPVLDRSPVVWATTVRQLAATAAMAPFAFASRHRGAVVEAFRPAPAWRFSLSGAVLGSYLALMLWIGGMKHTQASTAAILNQASTIFVLVLASVFLHEAFTTRKALAALMALAGIVIVTIA
jgi:drug/metabolite transporter (DMT)-like permease